MDEFQNLSHTVWDCKYHLAWIPKYRKKLLFGELRNHLGGIIRELAVRKESSILEGHLMRDHIRMLISIPQVFRCTGGGVHQRQEYRPNREDFWRTQAHLHGQHFWQEVISFQRSTDEAAIRQYIKAQEQEDRRLDQPAMFK